MTAPLPREYYSPETAATAVGVPIGTGKFWYLFAYCAGRGPAPASSPSSSGPRKAAKACLLIVANLMAMAQWSLLGSGVDFYQHEVGLSESSANAMTSATLSVCFLCSIIGGLGGDSRIGSVRMLMMAIFLAVASSAALAVLSYDLHQKGATYAHAHPNGPDFNPPTGERVCMSIATMLYAAATGICQTAIPNLIGDQHHDAHPQRLQFFYILFYAALQSGALLSRIAFPYLHVESGWFVAISALLTLPCGLALLLYTLNSAAFSYKLPVAHFSLHKNLIIIVKRMFSRHSRDELGIYYGTRIVKDTFRALAALRVHSPLPIFWALYFQMFGLWFIQTKNTDCMVFGEHVNAEHATVLNPLFDVILLFLFSGVFRFLRHACGVHVRAQVKIGLGYCCAVFAFVAATLLEHTIESRRDSAVDAPKVTVWLQLPQFFFICAAEVLVYPAALHIAYVNSPLSMRSFVQSTLWFFIGVGNVVNIIVITSASATFSRSNEHTDEQRTYVWLYAGYTVCMFCALLLYVWLCWRFDDLNYWELEEEDGEGSHNALMSVQKAGLSGTYGGTNSTLLPAGTPQRADDGIILESPYGDFNSTAGTGGGTPGEYYEGTFDNANINTPGKAIGEFPQRPHNPTNSGALASMQQPFAHAGTGVAQQHYSPQRHLGDYGSGQVMSPERPQIAGGTPGNTPRSAVGGSSLPQHMEVQHRRPVTPRDGVQYYSTRRKSANTALFSTPQPKQQQYD